MTADIDVVIPALNAARSLARTLDSLRGEYDLKLSITVCDGGSRDDTASVARQAGTTVVETEAGRGRQLAAGAMVGSALWLLFVHADTRLSAGWAAAARRLMAHPTRKAGYFRLRFDSADPRARRIERLAAWRCRTFALPYGDQGLLIERAFYQQLGGFRALPLMEDVDFVRRIGRRNLLPLDAEAVTSAARYERDGWLARPMRNLGCLALYLAGLPPTVIRRLYG
ncbi:MAG: TIGR04283 family arsenosugar biosynthesis glycosyltransferase [Rhodospirillales bacterium]|nr:TIGR04283 family arsenosugar biosynthesis glycosyltransferase [Rhodospirillales bacterium]